MTENDATLRIGTAVESSVMGCGTRGYKPVKYISPAVEDFCRTQLARMTDWWKEEDSGANEMLVAEWVVDSTFLNLSMTFIRTVWSIPQGENSRLSLMSPGRHAARLHRWYLSSTPYVLLKGPTPLHSGMRRREYVQV